MSAKSLRSLLLLALLAAIATSSGCGGDGADSGDKKPEVFKKKDSVQMKTQGTAESEEESQRREQEEKEAADRQVAEAELAKAKRALRKAEDSLDIAEALAEIARIGPAIAHRVAVLEPYLKHKDGEVRGMAYRAYGALKGEEGRLVIQEGLKDDDPDVKVAVLDAWRAQKFTRLLPVLALLRDYESEVQYAAARVVTESETQDAQTVSEVVGAMEDFQGPAMKIVLPYLMKNKDRVNDLETKLIKVLNHQDAGARIQAIKCLGTLDSKKKTSAMVLARLLGDDPNAGVARQALILLKTWGGGASPDYDPEGDAELRRKQCQAWLTWIDAQTGRFK